MAQAASHRHFIQIQCSGLLPPHLHSLRYDPSPPPLPERRAGASKDANTISFDGSLSRSPHRRDNTPSPRRRMSVLVPIIHLFGGENGEDVVGKVHMDEQEKGLGWARLMAMNLTVTMTRDKSKQEKQHPAVPQSTNAHSSSTASCITSPPWIITSDINIPLTQKFRPGDGGLVISRDADGYDESNGNKFRIRSGKGKGTGVGTTCGPDRAVHGAAILPLPAVPHPQLVRRQLSIHHESDGAGEREDGLKPGTSSRETDTDCLIDPSTSSMQAITLQMCGNGIVEVREDCNLG
ncbi:hypothetical protein C8J56DRAFT_1165881 [Mycena floridula]|nr:hypothetical protein C8J56DRAFT_1165881 [Mycena floridula]